MECIRNALKLNNEVYREILKTIEPKNCKRIINKGSIGYQCNYYTIYHDQNTQMVGIFNVCHCSCYDTEDPDDFFSEEITPYPVEVFYEMCIKDEDLGTSYDTEIRESFIKWYCFNIDDPDNLKKRYMYEDVLDQLVESIKCTNCNKRFYQDDIKHSVKSGPKCLECYLKLTTKTCINCKDNFLYTEKLVSGDCCYNCYPYLIIQERNKYGQECATCLKKFLKKEMYQTRNGMECDMCSR